MPAQIVVNQTGKPAGVAGKAREDLATGTNITLTSAGGPFLQYLWSIVDKPVDIEAAVQSAAVLLTPTSSATVLTPVDKDGTYEVELLVDSGRGLGATADDVARITFYAGATLATDPTDLPRREPAFQERLEHNVNDLVFPSGNSRGWAQTMGRWFSLIKRMWYGRTFAWGRVTLAIGGASVVSTGAYNVSVARNNVGIVTVTFLKQASNANYAVLATARGTTAGHCVVNTEGVASFMVYRYTAPGVLVDADFCFEVKHRSL